MWNLMVLALFALLSKSNAEFPHVTPKLVNPENSSESSDPAMDLCHAPSICAAAANCMVNGPVCSPEGNICCPPKEFHHSNSQPVEEDISGRSGSFVRTDLVSTKDSGEDSGQDSLKDHGPKYRSREYAENLHNPGYSGPSRINPNVKQVRNPAINSADYGRNGPQHREYYRNEKALIGNYGQRTSPYKDGRSGHGFRPTGQLGVPRDFPYGRVSNERVHGSGVHGASNYGMKHESIGYRSGIYRGGSSGYGGAAYGRGVNGDSSHEHGLYENHRSGAYGSPGYGNHGYGHPPSRGDFNHVYEGNFGYFSPDFYGGGYSPSNLSPHAIDVLHKYRFIEQCGVRTSLIIPSRHVETPYGQRVVAREEKQPWQAAVFGWSPRGYGLRCSATMVHPYLLITSAHCLRGIPEQELKVVFGISDLLEEDPFLPAIERGVSNMFIHERFDATTLTHDVALLVLSSPIALQFTPHVAKACLPEEEQKFVANDCRIVGWNEQALRYEGPASRTNEIKIAELQFLSPEECQKEVSKTAGQLNPSKLTKEMHCVKGKENLNSCIGSAGGALLCRVAHHNSTSKHFIAGIVSWSNLLCGSQGFAVITELTPYIDWINDLLRGAGGFDNYNPDYFGHFGKRVLHDDRRHGSGVRAHREVIRGYENVYPNSGRYGVHNYGPAAYGNHQIYDGIDRNYGTQFGIPC